MSWAAAVVAQNRLQVNSIIVLFIVEPLLDDGVECKENPGSRHSGFAFMYKWLSLIVERQNC